MSETDDHLWLESGRGLAPERNWSFTTDAPLTSLTLARESGEVIAADESGGVYLFDRLGQVVALTRGLHVLQDLAWSDDGRRGAAVIGDSTLCVLGRHLKPEWTQEFSQQIAAIDIAPFGNHVAVCLANGENRVIDMEQKTVGRFETIRPLGFLKFVPNHASMIGAADYGLLCRYRLNGQAEWSENLWSNVGDISLSGDGRAIYLASFSYGIQRFDGEGENRGAYIVEGSPGHVATTWAPKRMAVSTVERQLYWMDADGELLWATAAPDELVRLRCDALGKGLVCGFRSGRIVHLVWGLPERD